MVCVYDEMKLSIFLYYYMLILNDPLNKLSCLTYACYLENAEIMSRIYLNILTKYFVDVIF